MKASLKIQDYNPKRDFAGWGVEEFRAIAGHAGLSRNTRRSPAPAPTPAAWRRSISTATARWTSAFSARAKVVLLQNAGGSLNEVPLARSPAARVAAAWADYNGDGKPDLLLATPGRRAAFQQRRRRHFKDASAGLPARLQRPTSPPPRGSTTTATASPTSSSRRLPRPAPLPQSRHTPDAGPLDLQIGQVEDHRPVRKRRRAGLRGGLSAGAEDRFRRRVSAARTARRRCGKTSSCPRQNSAA